MRIISIEKTPEGRLGFSLSTTSDRGEIVVCAVVKGLPADRAGVKLGDVLHTVEGQQVSHHDGNVCRYFLDC